MTLHHNHYKDLQDRMPRLRGGDVHAYNLYVDSSNARIVKAMRDGIVAANPTLATALSSTYSFGITSQASISTEGGAVQIEDSVFFGVLTPFRNNQTDVNNPAYTGAIRGFNIQHILLATDTAYMPVSSQQTHVHGSRLHMGELARRTATRRAARSGRRRRRRSVRVAQRRPDVPDHVDPVAELPALLTGPQGAGAGKIGMTTQQWLQVAN